VHTGQNYDPTQRHIFKQFEASGGPTLLGPRAPSAGSWERFGENRKLVSVQAGSLLALATPTARSPRSWPSAGRARLPHGSGQPLHDDRSRRRSTAASSTTQATPHALHGAAAARNLLARAIAAKRDLSSPGNPIKEVLEYYSGKIEKKPDYSRSSACAITVISWPLCTALKSRRPPEAGPIREGHRSPKSMPLP